MIFSGLGNFCFADDWDDYIKIDDAAKNQQKTVTQDEFEKVMSRYEKKGKDAKNGKGKTKIKGSPMMQPSDDAKDAEVLKTIYDTYPTIMVPLDLITADNVEIATGFYRVMSVVKPYGHFLNFYQGNSLIAKVRSNDTNDDYGEKSLNYAKIIPLDERSVRFIYGDIDCNLETVLRVKNALK